MTNVPDIIRGLRYRTYSFAGGAVHNLRLHGDAPLFLFELPALVPASEVTGFAGGPKGVGRRVLLANVGTRDVTIRHLSNGSAARNRVSIRSGADYTWSGGEVIELVYDPVEEVWRLDARVTESGATEFLELTDVPDSYGGEAGRVPMVNSAENALSFERAWQTVLKSSDTSRSSTTALAADPELAVPVVGGTTVAFELFVFFNAPAAAGFKWDLNLTAGFAGPVYEALSLAPGGTAKTAQIITTMNSAKSITSASTGNGTLHVTGYVLVGSSANLQLRWAQDASSASSTRVHRGSRFRWQQV